MAYSDKQIIDALEKCGGNQSAAARALDCSRMTIHKRINSSDKVREAYDSVNEANIDLAENNLIDLIKDKEHKDHFGALKFYLRTKARDRGFGDKSDVNLSGSLGIQKIERRIVDPKDE